MTVPKRFRRNSAIPKVFVLHKADLAPTDSQDIIGVRATTPLRTISDLIADGKTDRTILKQAITEALARGLVTRRQSNVPILRPKCARRSIHSWRKAQVPGGKAYNTPQAHRTALEARLLQLSKRTGTDLQRLRRRVAFDRLLARMFIEGRSSFLVPERRLCHRAQNRDCPDDQDINLSIAARGAITPESLHRKVDDAASLDLADGLVFQVGESILDLDAAPQGGSRFPVQARMAG
jgi:hypothetical protein